MGKKSKSVKTVKISRHRPVSQGKKNRSAIRHFQLGKGIDSPEKIRKEMAAMRDVLMGRVDPPIEVGIMTLQEVAEAYFSRACDMEQEILAAQADGRIIGGNTNKNPWHTLRTQEIRSFKDMTKSATELGSRRVTAANLRYQQESRGRETGV